MKLAWNWGGDVNALVPIGRTFLESWAWELDKRGRYKEAKVKIEIALQRLKEDDRAGTYIHAAKIEQALGNNEKAKFYRMKEARLK